MSQDILAFVSPACELFALGEPAHREPGIRTIRNELFARLVEHGFRSIALETDRVAALAVQDYVHDGTGTLAAVLADGFTHAFGALAGNAELIAWVRAYNEGRPAAERVAVHGFDAPTETMNAPSPRPYLEHARDYLGVSLDVASLTGDDDRWSRTEAIMDPAASPGATPEADRLRVFADAMLILLHAKAAQATSRETWVRAKTNLMAGIGLLRYHKQAAQPGLDLNTRIAVLANIRDSLMAQNLLDIRQLEAERGPTLVFAHNAHLQRSSAAWRDDHIDFGWFGAGAIIGPLLGQRYTVVAGSLGRSSALDLAEPPSGSYESVLQERVTSWELVPTGEIGSGEVRTDTNPRQGYFPLDKTILDGVDAVLHLRG